MGIKILPFQKERKQDKLKIIEGKVQALKLLLGKTRTAHYLECYKYLAEIYDLRLEVQSDYSLANLFMEVGEYFNSYEELVKIMQLRHATPETREVIRLEKVSAPQICTMLTNSKLLQDAHTQNKFIERYVREEWTSKKAQAQLVALNSYSKERHYKNTAELYDEFEEVTEVSNETVQYNQISFAIAELERGLNVLDKMKPTEQERAIAQIKNLTEPLLNKEYVELDHDIKCLIEIIRNNSQFKHESMNFYIKQALQFFSKISGIRKQQDEDPEEIQLRKKKAKVQE